MDLLPGRLRSEALECLSDRTIAYAAIPGGVLAFFAPWPLLQNRAATVLTKEPDMIRWIDRLEESAVLWDIGANVGVFSLYAAVRTNCTVLSFEPSAANYFVLSRNIQLNRVSERITAYCLALSGTTQLGVLNLASEAPGTAMSHFGRAGEMSRYRTDDTMSAVQGMVGFTVDDFIARFNPPFPTHIKIDVDGLEWAILRGATKTLRDQRLRSAMVELSLTNQEERHCAIALFEESGFTCLGHGVSQRTMTETAANHLFERTVIAGEVEATVP
jgi:FkbM family methyltransferase